MKHLLKSFIYNCTLAIFALLSVTFLWRKTFILTAALIVISAIMLLIWKNKEDIYLYIFVGIFGAIAETIAIAFGAWTYSLPNLGRIPLWLPLLWGIAGIFISKVALVIHESRKKQI